MADGGFDPCECINLLSHEQRMQRLISMLRDSQMLCNDNECFNEVTGPNSSGVLTPGDGGSQVSMLTVMIGWIVIAMVLYFLRPSSIRRLRQTDNSKKGPDGNNQDNNRGRPVL